MKRFPFNFKFSSSVLPLRSLNAASVHHPAGWSNTRWTCHSGSQPLFFIVLFVFFVLQPEPSSSAMHFAFNQVCLWLTLFSLGASTRKASLPRNRFSGPLWTCVQLFVLTTLPAYNSSCLQLFLHRYWLCDSLKCILQRVFQCLGASFECILQRPCASFQWRCTLSRTGFSSCSSLQWSSSLCRSCSLSYNSPYNGLWASLQRPCASLQRPPCLLATCSEIVSQLELKLPELLAIPMISTMFS